MLTDIFQPFIKESSITVMTRGLMERLLNRQQLDEWFEQTAKHQYTRELLFSTTLELMMQVVCGVRRSVNRAYEAMSSEIAVRRYRANHW